MTRGPATHRRSLVVYADGPDGPRIAPEAVARLAGIDDPEVLLGWTPEPRPWLAAASLRGTTIMAGYALAQPVADGRLSYLPVRLSAVPSLILERSPEVVVVAGVRRGRDLAFRGSVGWGPTAAGVAKAVVVEVDEDGPDLGGPLVPGHITAVVSGPPFESPKSHGPRRIDEVDLAIGRQVVSILPDDPTLQFGPGGIAEGIIASLDCPVHIWSGLVTDAIAGLSDRGLLLSPATAGYVWGAGGLTRLASAGRLHLLPVEETHDLTRVSAIPRFVGCNTALQIGFDGAVNVERIGHRAVAGIGGHPDFCAAATRSVDGLSLIALRSTNRRGESTIVPHVDVVSTPRCDVDVVVTEHGIADLRGVDDHERAHRLISVAAPTHRESLLVAAPARVAAGRGSSASA